MKKLISYRTACGEADFTFSFEEQPGGSWLPIIISQPSYNGRPEDAHSTHRLASADGRLTVCWTEPIYSLEDAKKVAALWADETMKYRAGRPAFGDPS